MQRRSRMAATLATLLAAGLVAVACSGSASGSATPAASASSTAAPAASAPASGAAVASPTPNLGLLTPGTLTAATQTDQYPFDFASSSGHVQGFSIDLMNEIAHRLGLTVTYKTMAFTSLLSQVAAHQYDIGVAGVSITAARQQTVNFSEPYYYGYFGIIAAKSSGLTSVADLNGKTVAVVTGSAQVTYAQQNMPDVTLKDFPDQPTALAALNGGQVDAFFLGGPDTIRYLKDNPNLMLVAAIQLTSPNGFPIAKDDPGLKAAVDSELNAMYADGTWATIYKKWFTQPIPAPMISEYPALAQYK